MQQSQWLREETGESPLAAMTPEERLVADYAVNNLGLNLAQMGNQAQAEQAFRTSIRLMLMMRRLRQILVNCWLGAEI